MGSKWDLTENAILRQIYGGPDLPRLSTLYLALFTEAPTDGGGGTEVASFETGYLRLPIDNEDPGIWGPAADGAKANTQTLDFAVAEVPWGTIVAWGFFDAQFGGNRYGHWGDVSPGKQILTGQWARFAPGDLLILEA